jgi:hypothetical protein
MQAVNVINLQTNDILISQEHWSYPERGNRSLAYKRGLITNEEAEEETEPKSGLEADYNFDKYASGPYLRPQQRFKA